MGKTAGVMVSRIQVMVPGSPKEGGPKEGSPKEGSPKEGSPKEGSPKEGGPKEGNHGAAGAADAAGDLSEAWVSAWVERASGMESAHRVDRWARVDPRDLVPEARVRALCAENLCESYGRFPFCPPEVGSLEETGARLRSFAGCLVVQATFVVDSRDRAAVRRTRRAFQETMLALEASALEGAAREAALRGEERSARPWSLPGGTCALCDPCPLRVGETCPRPAEAHPSLEALGVDVVGLQERLGWDAAFLSDRVTWTGALLWGRAEQDRPVASGEVER